MDAYSGEDAAVRNLYKSLLGAWNERDADVFSSLFARNGTVIGYDGSQASGPEGIRTHLTPIFRDHPTARYVAHVTEVRALREGIVLLRASAGMVPPGASELNPAVNTLHTLIAEVRGDLWRIALFQNTPAQLHGRPELVDEHTALLAPLVASGVTVE